MQAVREDYKSGAPSDKDHLNLKPTLKGENIMRRAQVEVFLLSAVLIAAAMATSYEKTGDCGVSAY